MDKPNAIITGAAKGIGKAIAKRLKKEGFFCILIDVDQENGKELTKEFEGSAKFFNCDISSEKEVNLLFEELLHEYGKIDVLVNNAGIIRDNVIWKMPVEDFDKVLDVNLKGTWLMCKMAGEIMRKQSSGRIINITSRAWLGNRGQSNYAASKAGVVGLTRVLALELGKYGVLVNAVAPGLILTDLTQKLPQNVLEKLIEAQPTKSMGKPEDIANVVAFLCDEKTQFITGQTIYVDGGKSIGAGI
ncbi:MAG: SDR family NAD(P)-dependent oxidoreductase [Bacteroidetes bacterium]|nr:MAG: SDR family NAD(P)-dependent oxidoreductase [Bacteroidota bacterium]MBL1143309.1 SDR family oxidoreductase [Bacteroidota bacterium]MCB0802525.1 SDR family oxidoreductase [Flavobacteriales bacterium]NOG56111.1 SDR family oxidoreductase [Bacteroidota bacterium]